AYSVHDLEDALVTGQIDIALLRDDLSHLFLVATQDYLPDMTQAEAESALDSLMNLSCWPKEFDRSHRHLARLKDLTSQLVGRFALAAESETREHFGDGDLVRYSANLLVPRAQRVEVALLKSMAGHYIIRAEKSQERYATQQQVIFDLVDAVRVKAPGTLESFFLQEWNRASSEREKMRVVIDQIASLTDVGAYALHEQLSMSK
ncbi:MAG: deoxyguanosinetriphosphate triphosphohydrolase, partial [Actinomycetota bacterium]